MRRLIALVTAFFLFAASPAYALSLIRDAEIEHTLRMFGNPIFKVAGLKPSAIHLFIVQDDSINAYVAGGQNMFLHTGLLMMMTDPSMLLGVMAHETGHIADGHLARGAEQLKDAQIGSILGYVLGAAAAVAGGGQGAMGVLMGSQELAMRHLMSFSRANERAADEAGMRFLDALGVSASGMVEVFTILQRNEQMHPKSPDPYILTHPLTEERIEYVRNHAEHSSIPEGKYPKVLEEPLARVRAKLYAFLNLPPQTFARYPQDDNSVPARMARAIAWYKIPEVDKALAGVNGLIKDYPKDPFFYDLKGQILFENGRIREARDAYAKAVELLPNSALLLTSLAQAQITTNDRAALGPAVDELVKANSIDDSNGDTWRFLAMAEGKLGHTGEAHLALAEEAALDDDYKGIMQQADAALKQLPPSAGPARLRAEDLKRLAEQMKKDERS